jgi:hypothetical protein
MENSKDIMSHRLLRRIRDSGFCQFFFSLSTSVQLSPSGLYALFRLYIFIEMFVGLRDVPVGVYKTVQWTLYLPFFG